MTEWTKEWPTEPGFYWFYGWYFRRQYGSDPELSLIEVWESFSGGLSYVAGNHFLHKEEGAKGVWQKAVLPELPSKDTLND